GRGDREGGRAELGAGHRRGKGGDLICVAAIVLVDRGAASRLLDGVIERVLRPERTAGFHDAEQQHEQRRRDERELDDGGAAAAAREPAKRRGFAPTAAGDALLHCTRTVET